MKKKKVFCYSFPFLICHYLQTIAQNPLAEKKSHYHVYQGQLFENQYPKKRQRVQTKSWNYSAWKENKSTAVFIIQFIFHFIRPVHAWVQGHRKAIIFSCTFTKNQENAWNLFFTVPAQLGMHGGATIVLWPIFGAFQTSLTLNDSWYIWRDFFFNL